MIPLLLSAVALSVGTAGSHAPVVELATADSTASATAYDVPSDAHTSAASQIESNETFDLAGAGELDSQPFVAPSSQMLSRYYR